MRFLDRTGLKYGKLTVISCKRIGGRIWWNCRCDCGNQSRVVGTNLRDVGGTRSCGCSNLRHTTHGLSNKSTEYEAWKALRKRCNDPNNKHYGAKGVKVCKRWDSFENFLVDMGPRPASPINAPRSKFSIDRINNLKGYSPKNCRWTTQVEQRRNRVDSIYLTYHGKTQTPIQWAIELGISYNTLRGRLTRGLSIDRVLFVGPRLLRQCR
jgi:hypothetical protein